MHCVILAIAWANSVVLGAMDYMSHIDFPHPICEGRIDLATAKDSFTQIANDLPGQSAYNELVRLYHQNQTERFEKQLRVFRKVYESSPLQEAASFLGLQSNFDRLSEKNEVAIRETEKQLYQVLLLYPKSDFEPVITATVAGFWMKKGLFDRSLALYEKARLEFTAHPLACVFQMGAAESNFQMKNYESAQTGFIDLSRKCRNPRLRVGAEMRLADIGWLLKGESKGVEHYRVLNDNLRSFTKFYPTIFYSLGEIKYGLREYAKAEFYINEYLKDSGRDPKCVSYALKRLADIALQKREKTEKVVGLYLTVRDRSPTSDVGRYSYVQALLLELPKASSAEYLRKLRVIDDEIEKMEAESLRALSFLKKGLVLLDMGEMDSLHYLVRYSERTGVDLKGGPTGSFLKNRLLKLFSEQAKTLNEKSEVDEELLSLVEQTHGLWLQGTEYESRSRELFGGLLLSRLEAAVASKKIEKVLKYLSRWKESKIFSESTLSGVIKTRVTALLLGVLSGAKTPKEVAEMYENQQSTLRFFLAEPLFWSAVSFEKGTVVGDREGKKDEPERDLSSVGRQWSGETRDYLWWVAGNLHFQENRFDQAERFWLKVKDENVRPRARRALFNLYRARHKYSKALDVGLELYQSPSRQAGFGLSALIEVVESGKLWSRMEPLLRLSEKEKLESGEAASLYYVAGKAQYELGRCKQSVERLERALVLDPEAKQSSEGRYQLGKCFVKMGKKTEAMKVLEELVKTKDPFWSPLALNELGILSPKQ